MAVDLAHLSKTIEAHSPLARVVMVEIKGSTPRELGTAMLVWDTGQEGTIGGGALEYAATEAARAGFALGKNFITSHPLGPALGQCCGGYVRLFTEYLDHTTLPQPDDIVWARALKGDAAQGITLPDTIDHLTLVDDWIVEPIAAPKTQLWIWGAGHVGRALTDVTASLPEFDVIWVDTARERFPETISERVSPLWSDAPETLASRAASDAFHIVTTYSHSLDLELCHRLIEQGFEYAGLIGSATKWARFRSKLANLGHSSDKIAQITCPIGDPQLGKHPSHIALGVAVDLLARVAAKTKGRTT
jgi:xanthine dehydrogenase accessory factor